MMKSKIIHPLWIHLPAILVLLTAVSFTLLAWPLPESAAVHFNFAGQPDRYGSPAVTAIVNLILSLFLISLSIFMDELWARQEKSKSFNWFSLFDEVVVGMMCAIQISSVQLIASSQEAFVLPWLGIVMIAGLTVAAAMILEGLRPFSTWGDTVTLEDTEALRLEVSSIVASGKPLVYWDIQNPVYISALSFLLPAYMIAGAVIEWNNSPLLSFFLVVFGSIFILFYGGFRTLVTRKTVTIKMGVLGIRLLQLNIKDISSAGLREFSPLKDFGGYGIRINSEMQSYYLQGNRGVLLTTLADKKYLIGSDHPERLNAVIKALLDDSVLAVQ